MAILTTDPTDRKCVQALKRKNESKHLNEKEIKLLIEMENLRPG